MDEKLPELTFIEKEAMKEYLKLKQRNAPLMLIGPKKMGDALDLSRPRAYAILSKLEEKKILQKIERKGFILTDLGKYVLNELTHRTKILEIFFFNELGMDLESATDEASNLVLDASFNLISILCDRLGKPRTCPHNIEIPHQVKK